MELNVPLCSSGHTDQTSEDHLKAKILERTRFTARQFQLKAVLAVLNGLDVIVHAGTGSGKTLIFAAPHFVSEGKVSIVVSPLILLQQDQVRGCEIWEKG